MRTWFILIVVLGVATPVAAAPLVDCSKKEFQRPNSARSLYLWTDGAEKKIVEAKKKGAFDAKYGVNKDFCLRMIAKRGSAHCKEPNNAEYRAGLARLIKLCAEAAKPPDTKNALVDCKDKRFKRPGVSIELLLKWTDFALSALNGLQPHEGSKIKINCDRALKHAGTAHCKAPKDPKPKAAIAKVRKRCAAAMKTEADKKAAAAKAEVDRKAAAKANRKIVAFPRSTYRGGDRGKVAAAMKRALLASRLAKKASEVLRVQPMGRWKAGRYSDTKKRYKKITGLVLWWDKDSDGVCRFVSYNFIQDRGPLKAKSFCMGCPEGWTKCK